MIKQKTKNLREISQEELKQVQIGLLKQIISFCNANNITYYLWGGTALGAVRHKGYIPWDDDIDLAMPRKDYELFVSGFSTETAGVYNCNNNKYYPFVYAKVFDKRTLKQENMWRSSRLDIGIDVDVFPLDYGWAETEREPMEKKRARLLKKWQLSITKIERVKSLKELIIKLLLPFYHIGNNVVCKKINELSAANKEGSQIMLSVDSNLKAPLYLQTASFAEGVHLTFENVSVRLPKDYDLVLKQCYGDYMTLPPEDKRIAHHNFKAYWRD